MFAHDARPFSIDIAERAPNVYRVEFRVPASVEAGNLPELAWPADCEVRGRATTAGSDLRQTASLVACAEPLPGRAVAIRFPLFNPSLSAVARFSPLGREPRLAVLPPDAAEWIVPSIPSRLDVARDYLTLGIAHIWTGLDHLLFVAGLLLLAGTGRRILLAVTGFTLAHSITLSLAALGVVRVPVPPTEAAIALSILFLASEVARPRPERLAWRYPLLVSSSFGLLHGLGFAAALGEIGLAPDEIALSLSFFNVGVELGQIAFIAPILALVFCWRALDPGRRFESALQLAAATRAVLPWGVGALASFWLFERLAAF